MFKSILEDDVVNYINKAHEKITTLEDYILDESNIMKSKLVNVLLNENEELLNKVNTLEDYILDETNVERNNDYMDYITFLEKTFDEDQERYYKLIKELNTITNLLRKLEN